MIYDKEEIDISNSQLKLKSFDELNGSLVFFSLKPADSIYIFLLTICVVLFTLIIWGIFAPMDDVVKADVVLRPENSISSIKCVVDGEIVNTNYKNGIFVKKGDFLFALDTSTSNKNLENFKFQIKNTNKKISVNNAMLDFMFNGIVPSDKSSQEYIEVCAYLSEKKNYEASIKKAKLELQRQKELPLDLRVFQTETDLQMEYDAILLSKESWEKSKIATVLNSKTELENLLSSLNSSCRETERNIKNSVITAPIDGVVYEIKKVNPGDYILSGEEILKVIPENSKILKANLYIEPAYVSFVKEGNPVRIKFPGVPPSRFGQVETKISFVPPDAIKNDDGEFYFIAEALIEDTVLMDRHGKTASLIPGIPAQARIVTDRSTIAKMLLRKLDFIEMN